MQTRQQEPNTCPAKLGMPMTAHAVLLGVALSGSVAAQSPASTSQPRALGLLPVLSADEQSRLALSTAPLEVSSRASLYILTAAAYQGGRLRAPRKPGIVYMLARENWAWNPFAQRFWTGPPHFMLYAPFATQEDLGGFSGPHMPVVLWPGQPDAFIIVMAQDSSGH